MVWAIDQKGTKVPLDPRIPVYAIRSIIEKAGAVEVERLDREVAMASHFPFCRKPNTAAEEPVRPASPEDLEGLKRKWGDPAKNR